MKIKLTILIVVCLGSTLYSWTKYRQVVNRYRFERTKTALLSRMLEATKITKSELATLADKTFYARAGIADRGDSVLINGVEFAFNSQQILTRVKGESNPWWSEDY